MRAIQPDAGYYNDVSKIFLFTDDVLWIKICPENQKDSVCQLRLLDCPQVALRDTKDIFHLHYLVLLKSMSTKGTWNWICF